VVSILNYTHLLQQILRREKNTMKTPKNIRKSIAKKLKICNGSLTSTTATDIEEPRTSDMICQKILRKLKIVLK